MDALPLVIAPQDLIPCRQYYFKVMNDKLRYLHRVLWCLALFAPLSSLACTSALAQVSVDTLLTIGDDETADGAYLFTSIRHGFVRHDDGRLFVPDAAIQHIRVYDENGTFLRRLGRRGQGPGEFEETEAIALLNRDTLLVRDRAQGRVTLFDLTDHEVVATERLGHGYPTDIGYQNMPSVPRLLGTADGTRIMLGLRDPDPQTKAEVSDQYLFHALDPNFSRVERTFGSYDLVETPHYFGRLEAGIQPGYAILDEEESLWYAPGPYQGRLYIFPRTQNGWGLPNAIDGMHVEGPLYEIADTDDIPDGYRTIQTISTKVTGRARRSSAGLHRHPDGSILHFAYHVAAEEGFLTVERFSSDGNLAGVYQLFSDLPASTNPQIQVEAIDEEGNLYTIDRTGEAPVIRVLSVSLPE
jgi:hypothetical protein